MKLKAEDPGAEDYLLIDLDTRNAIIYAVEADDETGEYTELVPTLQSAIYRDKLTKKWQVAKTIFCEVDENFQLKTVKKQGRIAIVHNEDYDGIFRALHSINPNRPDVKITWRDTPLDPNGEEVGKLTFIDEHYNPSPERKEVDSDTN